jgi:kynureninase
MSIGRVSGVHHRRHGARLIRSWDEQWMELRYLGDRIGRRFADADAGQTLVSDSTSVLLYKAHPFYAVDARARAHEEMFDTVLPTDLRLLEGFATTWTPALAGSGEADRAGVTAVVAAVSGARRSWVLKSRIRLPGRSG